MLLVVLLGLVAAFLFAASAALQQHAARLTVTTQRGGTAAPARRSVLRPLFALVRRLVKHPLWLVGWVTNLVGFLTQAAALHFGSVALVQPLLVTQLLFALPMAAAWSRRWPGLVAWLGASSITGGVVVFLAVRGVAPVEGTPDRYRVVLAGVSTLGLVAVLVLAAAGRPPLAHATLMAVAAGLCFAMSAVLIKLTASDLLDKGIPATAVDWPGYALAVSTGAGLLLEQGAFAAGSLSAAVAAMTITNPLASYVVGVLAFHVMPPTSPGALAALTGSGALLFVGVLALARSPSVQPDSAVDLSGSTPADVAPSRST